LSLKFSPATGAAYQSVRNDRLQVGVDADVVERAVVVVQVPLMAVTPRALSAPAQRSSIVVGFSPFFLAMPGSPVAGSPVPISHRSSPSTARNVLSSWSGPNGRGRPR
jgi:hypothetical protein